MTLSYSFSGKNIQSTKNGFGCFSLALLFGMLLLLVEDYLEIDQQYNQWRYCSFTLLIFCASLALKNNSIKTHLCEWRTLKFYPIFYVTILVLGLCISYYSNGWRLSFLDFSYWLSVFSCVVILSVVWEDNLEGHILLFVKVCVLVFSIYFFKYWVGYVAMVVSEEYKPTSLVYNMVNIRFLNQVQVLAIPILFWCFPMLSSFLQKLCLFVLVSNLVVIYSLDSRGAQVALITIFFLACIVKMLNWNSIKRILWIIFVSVLIYFIGFKYVEYLFSQEGVSWGPRTNYNNRVELWMVSFNMWKDSPFFGQGGMSYILNRARPEGHPHNFIMQFIGEWGLLGLGLLIVVSTKMTSFFLKHTYQFRSLDQCLGGVWLSISAGCIYGLFSGVFVMPLPQVVLIFLFSFLLSYVRKFDASKSTEVVLSRKVLVTTVLNINFVLTLFLIAFSVLWRLFFNEFSSAGSSGPRFWMNSFFNIP